MRKTRKKAVSPVIATLLLILIAVAAAILVYVWVTGYTSSAMKQGAPELEEKIKVEAVSVDADGNQVVAYIRNIGGTTVTLSIAYLIDAKSNQVITTQTASAQVSPGDTATVTFSGITVGSGGDVQPGRTYIVKVVTSNGVEASLSFTYRP